MPDAELEVLILAKDQTAKAFAGINKNLRTIGTLALSAAAGGLAALGAGFVALATRAVPAASNLTESMNAVNVVFGESAATVLDWGTTAATQAGLAQSAFFQMSAQTGAMLQNLGLEQSRAAQESVNLAQRAADMASIFNTDVNDALAAIQAGLRGEADPLERFGVRLSQAAVKAKALEMGLIGATGEMDDQTRATAALALLYEQTDKLAGDFVNTSGELANAQRVAKAQFENFLATIGSIGLPILGNFFKAVSTQILPALNTFAKYIAFVVEEGDTMNDFLADLPPAIRPIAKAIGEVIVFIQDFVREFIRGLEATGSPLAAFMEALDNVLPEATIERIWAFIDGIRELWDTILTILEPIISWAEENVKLQDVLVALGIAIATVVVPAIVSLVAALAPIVLTFVGIVAAVALLRTAWETDFLGIRTAVTEFWNNTALPALQALRAWLAENIPVAIQRLKAFWVNVLQPAIQTVWNWVKTTVFPIIQTLWDWLQINVPAALQTLANFWTGTLKPAIEAVWSFVQTSVIPLLQSLWNLFQVSGALAVQIISGLWRNVLKPALETVWTFIKDNVLPILNRLWTFIRDTLGPIISGLVNGALANLRSAFQSVRDAIQWVIDKIAALIAKLSSVRLPDWVTRQSPSQFEMTFIGASEAIRRLYAVDLPRLQLSLAQSSPASNISTAQHFNLTIYSNARREDLVSDFGLMRALAEG